MSDELKPCPFCGGTARIESNRDWHRLYCAHDDDCALDADEADLMYPAQPGYLIEIAEVWNRRAAPASAPMGTNGEAIPLPPIERDEGIDRTYIPLPGGWEIQTKGKGSTFRIAHVPGRTRWMVLSDDLHEPLEAMARDTRNMIEQQANRIRHLERELAEAREVQRSQHEASASLLHNSMNFEAVARGGIDDMIRLHAAFGFAEDETIDADKMIDRIAVFKRELEQAKAAFIGSENARKDAERALDLITYIDGRTAGTAPAWQSIETAPKDGSAVLLSRPDAGGSWIGKYEPIYQSGYRPDNPWFSLMLNRDYLSKQAKSSVPTHWMPLPAAPTPLNGKEEAK